MSSRPIRDTEITGIWSFLLSINWEERWLWCLLGFHLCCLLASLLAIRLKNATLQASLFLSYLILVYSAEHMNTWAAKNWRSFSHQQYFDSRGMFISLVYSTPLLINSITIVVMWMWGTISMVCRLKKLQHKQQQKQQQQQQSVASEGSSQRYESNKEK